MSKKKPSAKDIKKAIKEVSLTPQDKLIGYMKENNLDLEMTIQIVDPKSIRSRIVYFIISLLNVSFRPSLKVVELDKKQ